MIIDKLTSAKSKINALLAYINSITEKNDASLGNAIRTLAKGYEENFQSLDLQLRLIGTWEDDLTEYTSTTAETITTDIDITDTQYIYLLTTIECDGNYDTSQTAITKEWSGFSIALGGLYENNNKYNAATTFDYRGVIRPHLWSELVSGIQVNHGISISNNTSLLTFTRKADTNCPRVMGGHYTVKVYAVIPI